MRLFHPEQQLPELSKAVGTSSEVWKWIASRSTATKHSYAARLMLALVVFNDYELFPGGAMTERREHSGLPSGPMTTAQEIERAKRIGTYRKIDRSKQYEGRYDAEMLLRSDNHVWAKVRRLEQIENRKFLYGMAIATATAILNNLPKIWAWLHGVTR